ncbi:sec-independent protein translocase protein TatC [Thermostichus sp. MS-CIW-21]|jgi:sec-independent protein translocase protein TatC|nr:Sec-independent protein translocase TatC [Synechococcus sp. JA-2-3B'a(2-13)]
MTLASETESPEQAAAAPEPGRVRDPEFPYEVEMTLMEHLEELRSRLLASVIAVAICIIACFAVVNRIVALLEVPARGVTFLQLAPGEYFFVSVKVAAYSGLLLATPFLLYQIARFVLPGLSVKERKLLGPVVLGSSLLFVAGLVFAYYLLIPAALNFFIRYGEGVVDQAWSIDRYFEFVLLLLFSTGLAFQVPILQALLGALGLVTAEQMFKGWRYVVLGAVVAGAILTPSTDPLTQSLLAGAVTFLYLFGILLVKLLGK